MFLTINSPELVGLNKEDLTNLLGGKGAGLVWMANQGVQVPPFVVLPTNLWAEYDTSPKTMMKKINKIIPEIIDVFKEQFGYLPLLSVRSGARVSCPGMMDTILNVGLTAKTKSFWDEKLGAACADDCFKRLAEMYGSVVLEKSKERCSTDNLPATAHEQIYGAIEAVFKSWNNDRAKFYRKMHNIPETWGTAVVVQAMVFGNFNENSGSGVLFTRNPDTGENVVTGEFLTNAQGEDVVAGVRTPMPLSKMAAWNQNVATELMAAVTKLEQARKDVQDVEFTVQDGVLYILQTRNAKRTAAATIRIALDMAKEGMISEEDALKRVSARDFDIAQQDVIDPKYKVKAEMNGLSACMGVVTGKPVFSAQDAIDCKVPCILVTAETTPDDIAGMHAAKGVITMTGGATCHAAVVARSMNKPCIVGVGASLDILKAHAKISMDGATGRIWFHEVPVIKGNGNGLIKEFRQLLIKLSGIVPASNEVILGVDEMVLDVSADMGNPDLALNKVKVALDNCEKVYVDIRQGATEAEFSFIKMFGAPDEKAIADMIVALPGAKEKVVLVTSLTQKKYPTVTVAKTLEDVVLAHGEMAISEVAGVNIEALAKVAGWQKKDGIQFLSVGKIVEGIKSLASPEAAMALFSK